MRRIAPALLLLLALPGFAEDLEQITLRDGRVLIGRYDEAERKLYLRDARGGKVRVAISVDPRDVASRTPWLDPDEAARRQAAADEAKRQMARVEAERATAASRLVRETIDAQNERQRETELEAAARARRIEAEARAEFWRKQGHSFDPAVFSARDMDLFVERMEQRRRLREAQEVEAAREAALERVRQAEEDERRKASEQERRQAALERQAKAQEDDRIRSERFAAERQRLIDEQRARERKDMAMAITVGLIVIAFYAIPLIIALVRRHRFRLPIAVLCLVSPLLLGGGWVAYGSSSLSAAIGAGVAAAIGGVFAVLSWLGGLLWAVMPGMSAPAAPRPDRPGRRRRPVPAHDPAPDADGTAS